MAEVERKQAVAMTDNQTYIANVLRADTITGTIELIFRSAYVATLAAMPPGSVVRIEVIHKGGDK